MKIKIFVIIAFTLFSTTDLLSQVTLGSDITPADGAILDLKQEDTNKTKNSKLGMKIPRVELSNVYELYPMYGAEGSEDAVYTANKADIKTANKGLMVYNMANNKGLIPGMYLWDGEKWMNFKTRNMKEPQISELICDAAYMEPAYYTAGIPFNGVLKIPYIGGNGGIHTQTDVISANGLIFTLQQGQLADGVGTITYRVTGTPTISSPETTTINTSFTLSGVTYNCPITVGYSPEKELRYTKKIVPIEQPATGPGTTENSELYLGNLVVRYNYDTNRNGANFLEFKVDEPAHITYFFDKNKGYGTYGQYPAAEDVWYNFMSGYNTAYKRTSMGTDGNLNSDKRDISTAYIVVHRDSNRDVYRLTAISNAKIDADGSFPEVPAYITLFLEVLETQINYNHF